MFKSNKQTNTHLKYSYCLCVLLPSLFFELFFIYDARFGYFL